MKPPREMALSDAPCDRLMQILASPVFRQNPGYQSTSMSAFLPVNVFKRVAGHVFPEVIWNGSKGIDSLHARPDPAQLRRYVGVDRLDVGKNDD